MPCHEYDKLRRSSSEERGASATYKLFGAEYNDSRNSSEFQERVRDRLKRERYSMQESESRSSYRRYLSEAQLSAWSSCVNRSAVILIAESVSDSAFPVRVKWYPPPGVGLGTLIVRIQNATINGSSQARVRLEGTSEQPFIVVPDKSTRQIVMTAEILGVADTLALPRTFPLPTLPPPPVTPPKKTTITIAASEFL